MGFENKFRKKPFYVDCGAETKDLILEDQNGARLEDEEIEDLGIPGCRRLQQE